MKWNTDCIPLMRQLARMAEIPEGRIKRMVLVLVLDVDDVPRLYTEGYLMGDEELVPTKLEVEDKPLIVDTTTMQNQNFRTYQPKTGEQSAKTQEHSQKNSLAQ